MSDFIPISISVANRIKDQILLEKRYAPGGKLPNEHELAEELGVSRTSIREAVKTLVATGLLRVERGKGTFVALHLNSPGDPFGVSYLEDKKKLAAQWFEMRLILEPSIVRFACERASDSEIRTILDCERKAAIVIGQNKNISRADQKFHAAIARAAHNDVIERMLPAMTSAIEDILRTSLYSGRQERSRENALSNHRMIARFIEQRDAEGGAMAMYYHIKKGLLDLQ
jgi:DNA-binding FadR family transcriptional regulator